MRRNSLKKLLSLALLLVGAQSAFSQSWNLVWREDFGVAEDTVIKDFPNTSMTVPRHSYAGYESKAHYGSAGYIEYHEQGDWQGECGYIDDGQYGIANSTWWAYNRFKSCDQSAGHFVGGRDHTGNKNGAMLVVNSEVGTGLPIYTQQIEFDLCDSREYKFVIYAASITAYQDDGGNADLEMKVINTKTGEEIRNIRTKEIPYWEFGGWGTPNPSDCATCDRNWSEYSCTFTANDGDVLELQVVNWGSGYNDFVIDDISLYRNDTEEIPDPIISATSVSQAGSKNDCSYLAVFSVPASVLTEWKKIYDKVYFLWQQSTDDGVTWTNVKEVSGIDKLDAEIEMDKNKSSVFRVIITGGSTNALAEEQALYIAQYGGPKGGCAYYSISNTLSAQPKADCSYSDDLLALFVDDFGSVPSGAVESPYCKFNFVEKGLSAGNYAVTANPNNTQKNSWDGIPEFTDHTGNADGGMLYCRVNKETGTIYERVVSGPFCNCKSYIFSFNAAALGGLSTLYMEGQVLDTKGNILASLPIAQGNGGKDAIWRQYQIDFSPAEGTGSLIFKIVSTDPGTESYGTQVVIDDISLRVCGMHIPQDSIYINNNPKLTSLTGFDCTEKPSPTINLSSMEGWTKNYPDAVAVWQTSNDGGLTWNTLSATGKSVAFETEEGGTILYRAIVAENAETAKNAAAGVAGDGCGVYLITNTVTLECTAQCHFNDDMLVLWKDDFGSVPAGTRKECAYLKGHKFLKDMKKSVDDGEYAVVSRMQDAGSWFAAMDGTDHTGDADGGFLVINISKTYKDKVIYEQELGFTTCENTSYYFSLWASSISKRVANGDKTGVLCNLTMEIVNAKNDEVLASIETGDMPNAESLKGQIPWKNYGVSFVSTGEKVKLRIYDHAGNGDKGNDLALDDISLIACDEAAPKVELSVNGEDDVVGLCGVDEYTLKVGDLTGWNKIYNDNVYCLWQKSEDGGETWENLTEESGLASEKGDLTITALRNMQNVNDTLVNVGIRYRVIVAGPKSEVTEQIAKQGYPNDGCYLYRVSNVMTVRCECVAPEFDFASDKEYNICQSEEPIVMAVQQTNAAALDTVRWFSKEPQSDEWKREVEFVGAEAADNLSYKVLPTDSIQYLFLGYSESCVSDSMIFTVNVDKPIELEDLVSTTLCVGSDTTYKAVVTKGYPLSYEWNGAASTNDEFPIASVANDVEVSLVAKGAVCVSEEKTATVTAEAKVELAASLEDKEVCAFDEITVDSKAVAQNIQWYQSKSGSAEFTEIDGGTEAVLTCSPDSNRTYKVVASGVKCPSKEISFDVVVNYPAVIEASIDEIEYCVGGSSTINVTLDHVTSLRWMKKQEGETAYTMFKEGVYSESDTETSEIVTPTVTTQYLVQTPSVGCAAAQSEVFTVTVEQPVDFTLTADKAMVCRGADNAEITLTANLVAGVANLVEGNAADVMPAGTLVVNPTETTTYTLGITGKLCPTKVEKEVEVIVEVPTTFSELKVSDELVCENAAVTFDYTVDPVDAPYKLMVNAGANTPFKECALASEYVQTAESATRCYKLESGAGKVCVASASNVVCVAVEDSAKFDFTVDKPAVCEGTGVTFAFNIPSAHRNSKFTFDGVEQPALASKKLDEPESKMYVATLEGKVCPKVVKSVEVDVQKPASLNLTTVQTSVCVNTPVNITLTAENAKSTQWWSSADGVAFVKMEGDGTNLLPQTNTWYKATAVGSEMCPGAESNVVSIEVEDSVRFAINEPAPLVCSGTRVASVITIKSGTPTSVVWTKNGTKVADVVSLTDMPTDDTNTYEATVEGTVCPSVSKSFVVDVEQQPVLGEISSCCDIACVGSTVDLSVTAQNAKGLVWTKRTSAGVTTLSEANEQTQSDVISETSYYQVSTTGAEVCKNISSKEVKVQAEEKVMVTLPSELFVCPGVAASLEPEVEGRPVEFVWKANEEVLPNKTASLKVTPETTTTYTVTAMAKSCESAVANVVVNVERVPSMGIEVSSDSICEGEDVDLIAEDVEGVSLNWMYKSKAGSLFSDLGATAATYTTNPLETTIYSVQYTTEHGCTGMSNAVEVNVSAKVNATTADTFVCEGSSVSLKVDGSNAFHYAWYADAGHTQLEGEALKITVSPAEATTYYVVVTNGKCSEELAANVNVVSNPKVVALEDRADREIEVVVDGGGGSYEYNYGQDWTKDNLFTNFHFSTQYTIQVRDVMGCVGDTTFRTKSYDIKVPIFFTPNGDGINDFFEIENISKYPDAKIRIYDRWGKKLIETVASEYGGWDGTYNGNALPSTDYWYEIWVEELDKYYTGHFTLVRGKK